MLSQMKSDLVSIAATYLQPVSTIKVPGFWYLGLGFLVPTPLDLQEK